MTRSQSSILRVVVTGSECTGKTTLSHQLASHFGTVVSPEFSRQYAVERAAELTASDVEPIAHGQIELEDRYTSLATGLLVQDTDLASTVVYATHYYGDCPDWIVTAWRERLPDLYLLLSIDVPWIADTLRDRGDRRAEVQSLFQAAVEESGAPFIAIEGPWDSRLQSAIEAVQRLVDRA